MRPPLDLTLYLVTDTALCGGPDGVVRTVEAAARGGVTCVQLRDPAASDDELVDLGRRLVRSVAPHGIPLIVNDRPHLVAPIGAQGVHLGQGDGDVVAAREAIGPNALLGLSVQTSEMVEAARPLGDAVDYLGVGPVWPTPSKPNHAPAGGVRTAFEVASVSPWPCVLIGGIHPPRVRRLVGTGAQGIAVISAICGTPDPETAARELRAEWEAPV
ncbi:thiamine phosphate synthase [Knoellia koreensis]|uniref:Thiamine-phosphate synthase n=1 Tax=Knoellia koreensis TaxID=2730921 RepID=A0A849HCY4_9MICO|nr:thiamine phosphate synthase [Knoellia sp. DB2414S]